MNTNKLTEPNEFIQPLAAGRGAKWAYFSLIYSLFYWVAYFSISTDRTAMEIFNATLYFAAFIGIYLYSINQPKDKVLVPIFMMLIIISASCWINPGASGLYGFVAFMTGFYYRMSKALGLLMINILAQAITVITFALYSPSFWVTSLVIAIVLFVFGRFNRLDVMSQIKQDRQDQEIENLAAIAERERIARDMHDLLGHSLSSIALKSELAGKLLSRGEPERAGHEITEVATLSREVLSEVRMAVTGLKQKGLRGVLENLTTQLEAQEFIVQLQMNELDLKPKVESALIFVAKESVTNILRHSNGNQVSLSLSQEQDVLWLTISDNGKNENKQMSDGNGLDGMRSRMEELGGEMQISRLNGFTIKFGLPVTLALGANT